MATIYAHLVRSNRETWMKSSRPLVDELRTITNDPDLNEAGRANKLFPIRQRIQALYDEVHNSAVKSVADARKRYLQKVPEAVRREGVFAKPERAVAIRTLATGAPFDELLALANLAAEHNDPGAAYGLWLVTLASIRTLSEDQVAQINAALEQVTTPETADALADYAVASGELFRLEADKNWNGDGPIDPLRMLQDEIRSLTLDAGNNRTRTLSAPELSKYYAQVGLPMALPSDIARAS